MKNVHKQIGHLWRNQESITFIMLWLLINNED